MSAETVYSRISEVIAEECEADDSLTMFELIGVVRVVEAELIAAAAGGDDDEDEDADADAGYDD